MRITGSSWVGSRSSRRRRILRVGESHRRSLVNCSLRRFVDRLRRRRRCCVQRTEHHAVREAVEVDLAGRQRAVGAPLCRSSVPPSRKSEWLCMNAVRSGCASHCVHAVGGPTLSMVSRLRRSGSATGRGRLSKNIHLFVVASAPVLR